MALRARAAPLPRPPCRRPGRGRGGAVPAPPPGPRRSRPRSARPSGSTDGPGRVASPGRPPAPRQSGADYAVGTRHTLPVPAGIPLPRQGPVLTWRELRPQPPGPAGRLRPHPRRHRAVLTVTAADPVPLDVALLKILPYGVRTGGGQPRRPRPPLPDRPPRATEGLRLHYTDARPPARACAGCTTRSCRPSPWPRTSSAHPPCSPCSRAARTPTGSSGATCPPPGDRRSWCCRAGSPRCSWPPIPAACAGTGRPTPPSTACTPSRATRCPSSANALDLPPDRVRPLTFGVDHEELRPSAEASDGPFLAVGRDRGRDWPTLLAALGAAGVRRPGPVPTGRHRRPRRSHPTSRSSASSTGPGTGRSSSRRGRVLVATQVLGYPSGQSVTLEAMACGRPVDRHRRPRPRRVRRRRPHRPHRGASRRRRMGRRRSGPRSGRRRRRGPRPGRPPIGRGVVHRRRHVGHRRRRPPVPGGRPTGATLMRVLSLIDSLARGGAERSLVELAPHLRTAGIDLRVAVLEDRPGFTDELRDQGFPVSVLDPGGRVATGPPGRPAPRRRPDRPVPHHPLRVRHRRPAGARPAHGSPPSPRSPTCATGPSSTPNPGLSTTKLRAAQALDIVTARAVRRFHAVSTPVADAMAPRLRVPRERIEVIPRGRDRARLGRPSPDRRRATPRGPRHRRGARRAGPRPPRAPEGARRAAPGHRRARGRPAPTSSSSSPAARVVRPVPCAPRSTSWGSATTCGCSAPATTSATSCAPPTSSRFPPGGRASPACSSRPWPSASHSSSPTSPWPERPCPTNATPCSCRWTTSRPWPRRSPRYSTTRPPPSSGPPSPLARFEERFTIERVAGAMADLFRSVAAPVSRD